VSALAETGPAKVSVNTATGEIISSELDTSVSTEHGSGEES
jgi:hypothetical protein